VARATGEDIGTIRHMGFSVADPEHVHFDPEPSEVRAIEDRIIDWDRPHHRLGPARTPPERVRRAPALPAGRARLIRELRLIRPNPSWAVGRRRHFSKKFFGRKVDTTAAAFCLTSREAAESEAGCDLKQRDLRCSGNI